MKILEVNSSNIDMAIDGLEAARHSNDQIKSYLRKSDKFFSNCEISLKLSNVRGYELLMLSDFCSSITVIDKEIATIGSRCLTQECANGTNDYYKERRAEVNELSRKSFNAYSALVKTYSDNTELTNDFIHMIPIGSINYTIIARFEGTRIYSILTAMPCSKFVNHAENGEFYDINSKEFANMIAKNFVENFYKFMESESSLVDVLSDVVIKENYYDYLYNDEPDVKIAHINTPYGKVQFLGVESDEFTRTLSEVKSQMNEIKDVSRMKNLTLFMPVRASLYTYLVFKILTNLVSYNADLNLNMSKESEIILPNELDETYSLAYGQAIRNIDKFRLEALHIFKEEDSAHTEEKARSLKDRSFAAYLRENGSKVAYTYKLLELYQYMPLSSLCTFILSGSYCDFIEAINFIEFTHNSYIETRELTSIINLIKS